MLPFKECLVCSGELVEKEVQKLPRGGNHTAILTVQTAVCLQCGECLYSADTIRQFEKVKKKLESGQTEEFTPIGQFFRVG